jgi:hypothetical protein
MSFLTLQFLTASAERSFIANFLCSSHTHYNHHRYHESLSNLTPADVCFGRGATILLERERIKRNTINQRRLQYRNQAA